MDFVDGGEEATFPQIQDTYAIYYMITFIGTTKKKKHDAENAAQAVLT